MQECIPDTVQHVEEEVKLQQLRGEEDTSPSTTTCGEKSELHRGKEESYTSPHSSQQQGVFK